MFSKVLNYLKTGGDANTSTISRKLDIEEGTIVMILDQLVKRGYLEIIDERTEELEACIPTKCSGCAKISDCSSLLKVKYKLIKK